MESNSNSLIIEEREVVLNTGGKIYLQFISTADMQKDAKDLSFRILPYTLAGSGAAAHEDCFGSRFIPGSICVQKPLSAGRVQSVFDQQEIMVLFTDQAQGRFL